MNEKTEQVVIGEHCFQIVTRKNMYTNKVHFVVLVEENGRDKLFRCNGDGKITMDFDLGVKNADVYPSLYRQDSVENCHALIKRYMASYYDQPGMIEDIGTEQIIMQVKAKKNA